MLFGGGAGAVPRGDFVLPHRVPIDARPVDEAVVVRPRVQVASVVQGRLGTGPDQSLRALGVID